MKRTRKVKLPDSTAEPTPEQVHAFLEKMDDEHQQSWHQELMGDEPPHWVYMLGLHLRMVELEHLTAAAQELL